MGCFMFDVETLGVESNSVVLSAAITHFDLEQKDLFLQDPKAAYVHYVERSLFVKFAANEQIDNGRVANTETSHWWMKQSEIARDISFFASTTKDLPTRLGIEKLRDYINQNGGNNQIVWARGSLDQIVIDSLCRSVGVEPLFMYNKWRDVRTAIDILATDSHNGYVNIPNFNSDTYVIKHVPYNDCALDILQLIYACGSNE